jgi:hypothetical protein
MGYRGFLRCLAELLDILCSSIVEESHPVGSPNSVNIPFLEVRQTPWLACLVLQKQLILQLLHLPEIKLIHPIRLGVRKSRFLSS